MLRDDFRNYVNQFGKNWSINNSIRKKNIYEGIEKLFEKIQDGFVGDFKSQINMLKMTDEDKELLDDCLQELVEECLIQNQSKEKVCPYCGQSSQTVFVHGHEQCVVCKPNVEPCCQGEVMSKDRNT